MNAAATLILLRKILINTKKIDGGQNKGQANNKRYILITHFKGGLSAFY